MIKRDRTSQGDELLYYYFQRKLKTILKYDFKSWQSDVLLLCYIQISRNLLLCCRNIFIDLMVII